jgi:hypothetical protein
MTEPTIEEKTSYCDSVPCTIHDHSDWLDRVKNYHHSQPSVSALEQFNEEVIEEIRQHYAHDMGDEGKSVLLQDVEVIFEKKLTAHKELILKMVREKAPKLRIVGYQTYCLTCNGHLAAGECDCGSG